MKAGAIRSRGWDGMCDFLLKQPVARKRILAFAACSRCVWDRVQLECNRRALLTSELFADGEVTRDELVRAWQAVRFEPVVYSEWCLGAAGPAEDVFSAQMVPRSQADDDAVQAFQPSYDPHSELSRERVAIGFDVFGHRFRRVAFDQCWRTEAVVGLARGMYESRDFGPMPVLADALEDAGCADADVLAHCRGDGPHVRGCWVVDLVLGQE